MNPLKLLEVSKLELLKEYQVEELSERFYSEIIKIHNSLPRLEYWIANRIDYAVNINTPYVKEYIKLFQRGDKPKGFKDNKKLEVSLYLSSNSVTINFYDKENERLWN